MITTTKHAPGTFCWPELSTTDQDAAKRFYGAVFGWAFNDTPMGPGQGVYTTFQLNGQPAGACYALSPDMLKNGVPTQWGAYIATASADASAMRAKELGGQVLMEPLDVMGTIGRMAVIQDPQGAVFSVWQAKDHTGVGVLNEAGALCWTELMTTDTTKARAFYSGLNGWTSEDMPMGPGTYTVYARPDGTQAGGMMAIGPDMKDVSPAWMTYFQVADIQATVNQVSSLGGKTFVPVQSVPNVGQFAILGDPQGAAFGVLQPPR